MNTPGLLEHTMTRMILSGILYGAGLGALYGILISPLGLIVSDIQHEVLPGLQSSEAGFFEWLGRLLLQVIVGLPLFAVTGIALGFLAGLALGVLCGLALFALTRASFFHPEGQSRKYQEIAGWTCAVTTVAPLLALWVVRDFDTDVFVPYPNPAGTIDSGPIDLIFVTIVPMLIAGWAARRSSRKVAHLWAQEARGAEYEDDAPSAGTNPTVN